MSSVAEKAGVQYIPPSNLRSTHLSLLISMGTPLTTAQEQAGHAEPKSTAKHYIRTYDEDQKKAVFSLRDKIHAAD